MKKLFYVLIIFLFVCTRAFATDYYVSDSIGDDAYNGLSGTVGGGVVGPWKTTGKINSFEVATGFSSGDTISFKSGDEWNWDGGDNATIGHNGADYINWGTINGLTIQSYGAGALPWLNANTMRPIDISDYSISNLTIKDLDLSGMDWGSDGTPGFNIFIAYVDNVVIDGLTINGHTGASSYNRHEGALKLGGMQGDIEVKNCTLSNFYKDTMPVVLGGSHPWASNDSDGLVIWYNPGGGVVKESGTILIHDNTFTNFYADGIAIGGLQSVDGTHIYDNTFSGFGEQAIDFKKSDYVFIYRNEISWDDFGFSPGGGSQAGVGIATDSGTLLWSPDPGSGTITIYGNYFHDSKMPVLYAGATLTKFYNNYCKNTGGGLIVGKSEIYNNLFDLQTDLYSGLVATQRSAFRLTQDAKSGLDNTVFYNNTFYITGSNFLYGIAWQVRAGQTDNKIKNNIIVMTSSSSVFPLYIEDYDSTNIFPEVDYNTYYNANHANRVSWDGETTFATYADLPGHTNEKSRNPDFTDPGTTFTLLAESEERESGAILPAPYNTGWNTDMPLPPNDIQVSLQASFGLPERGTYLYGTATPDSTPPGFTGVVLGN